MTTSEGTTIPRQLGIYRIESLLGRGGMGEVYLAWDELLERHVAIKRVLNDRLEGAWDDHRARARFLREARAVARLDHPAIVRIYHVLERDDGDALVMEYVAGQELSKLVAGGALGVPRAVVLGRDIAEGLAAAHAVGLVHRDLKLANVMVSHEGQVKILDFGLAKTLDGLRELVAVDPRDGELADGGAPGQEGELTREGALVGTVHAMSPEQAGGLAVDHRSDLFALGSLLYELLTGRAPFRGATLVESLRRVMTASPEPLERCLPGVDGALASLVGELLAKEPEQRPASTRQVAARLGGIARQLAPTASPGPEVIPVAMPVTMPVAGPEAAPDDATLFEPSPRPAGSRPVVRALVQLELGEILPQEIRRVTRLLLHRYGLEEVEGRGDDSSTADTRSSTLLAFAERPAEAVAFALALQGRLAKEAKGPGPRVGIHFDEMLLTRATGVGAWPMIEGPARGRVAELASRAHEGQTLLGRAAFDLARGASAPAELAAPDVRWLAHGAYVFGPSEEPFEVFEVGTEGLAPLRQPSDSDHTRRDVAPGDEIALGWRPAVGQEVPRRDGWLLVERLGEGGFGEVWLARHGEGEERVFKFCFEAERLRALEREVTLFRLLRETLGHRGDIARVLAWDFDQAPYFLESEYTGGGDLARWAERRGGLATVPLATRLELVAQVAEALAAAHSVGVLHKDVKPRNILVDHDADGRPRARLSDFGIGLLTRPEVLEAPGFTVLGFSEDTLGMGQSAGDGTAQYMAPELLAGHPATTQADLYSLGVVLYQAVVGDFDRVLAPGWRRDVGDALLEEDIALCVDGVPERRLSGPGELAERLRGLEERHVTRRAEEKATADRARAHRRRRIVGWLGLAASVLLLVVSIFAYQTLRAKNRELDARHNAEQRRAQAEALIDFLLGDLRRELQPIGKLDILDKVGDRAMEYFAAVDDAELSEEEMANYAKALHQIGQVRFALGKIPEAGEAFRQSLAMARRLAARDPSNAEWQFELGQSHFWLGFLRWNERDLDAALGQFESYREISRALVERDPSNTGWQLEAAYSYSNLGQVHEERGELEPATRELGASITLFEELVAADPENTGLSVEMAHVVAKMAQVLYRRGELRGSTERFRTALAIYRQAAQRSGSAAELGFYLGTTRDYLAELLLASGDLVGAAGELEAGVDVALRLADHDPDNMVWREALTMRLDRLGGLRILEGRLDEAQRTISEARDGVTALLAQDPEHGRWRFVAARNRCTAASWALAAERPGEAVELTRSCGEALDRLMETSVLRDYRYWRALAHRLQGAGHDALGDHARALEAWRKGAGSTRALVDASPRPVEIDLWVRLLLLLDRRGEAEPWIEQLDAMGYREPSYLAALTASGRSGGAS